MEQQWNGFTCETFSFEEMEAVVVFPKPGTAVGKLALKTEYWGAYPAVEIGLLEEGFHLAFLQNRTRFGTKDDCDRKARFVRYLAEQYGLDGRCVPVGMSCGGAHAVRFAGFYPELISCLFIDAPVLDFGSWPGKLGDAGLEAVWEQEFVHAYPGIKRYQLACFPEHPICMVDRLIEHRLPVLLVYGAEDGTVCNEENCLRMIQAYEGTDLLTAIEVPCRGHHPHGLIGDNTKLVRWIVEHSGRRAE